MSWLLFMDESGHDHKQMPYEVRGGIGLHAGEVWPFVQDFQRLELACYGVELSQMDEVEKSEDRRFVRRLHSYFTKTQTGRYRTQWIVPTPLFVASDMTYPIQAADLCIYCVNWGFRLPTRGMDAEVRAEIADEFGPWVRQLQFDGEGPGRDGLIHHCYGVVHVPDPYTPR